MGRTYQPGKDQYGGLASENNGDPFSDPFNANPSGGPTQRIDTGPDGARIVAKGDPNDPGSVIAQAAPAAVGGLLAGPIGGVGTGLFVLGANAMARGEGQAIDDRSAAYAKKWGYTPNAAGGFTGTGTSGSAAGTGGGMGSPVEQATTNQTMLNRPHQNTPFGFSSWSADGKTQNVGFNGPLGQTNDALQQQAYANALRGLPTGEDARNQAITGAYDQAASRLNPQWKQRDELLSSTLANQGLAPGSQAYRNAMLQQGQQRNDAYSSAMNGAIAQGTSAGNAIFNQGLASHRLPYDEMSSLHGLLQPFGFNQATKPDTISQEQVDWAKKTYGDKAGAEITASAMKLGVDFSTALAMWRRDNGQSPTDVSGGQTLPDPTGYADPSTTANIEGVFNG